MYSQWQWGGGIAAENVCVQQVEEWRGGLKWVRWRMLVVFVVVIVVVVVVVVVLILVQMSCRTTGRFKSCRSRSRVKGHAGFCHDRKGRGASLPVGQSVWHWTCGETRSEGRGWDGMGWDRKRGCGCWAESAKMRLIYCNTTFSPLPLPLPLLLLV